MDLDFLNKISPYVRQVMIQKSSSLYGEWIDPDNVFTYIESGEADFILYGEKYHLSEGDALIMHPFLTHIIKSDPSKILVQYIFRFDLFYDESRKNLDNVNILDTDKNNTPEYEMYFQKNFSIFVLKQSERNHLRNKFQSMDKEFTEKKTGYELMLKSIATEIIAILMRCSTQSIIKESNNSKAWANIEKAINFINQNYFREKLDNGYIGSKLDISPNYLSTIFKDYLGVSMHQYLTHVKIENAKKLILLGEKNFSEISLELGFSSIHVFSKLFKKQVGMTPSEFTATNFIAPNFIASDKILIGITNEEGTNQNSNIDQYGCNNFLSSKKL